MAFTDLRVRPESTSPEEGKVILQCPVLDGPSFHRVLGGDDGRRIRRAEKRGLCSVDRDEKF
jgi:hypothetical protein